MNWQSLFIPIPFIKGYNYANIVLNVIQDRIISILQDIPFCDRSSYYLLSFHSNIVSERRPMEISMDEYIQDILNDIRIHIDSIETDPTYNNLLILLTNYIHHPFNILFSSDVGIVLSVGNQK